VRRDLADVFSTLAEGCKAKKALEWKLVDAAFARSKFDAGVKERATKAAGSAAKIPSKEGAKGIRLAPLAPKVSAGRVEYKYVTLELDTATRLSTLTIRGPEGAAPTSAAAFHELGGDAWSLRAMREL